MSSFNARSKKKKKPKNLDNKSDISRYALGCAIVFHFLLLLAFLLPQMGINSLLASGVDSQAQCSLGELDATSIVATEFYLQRLVDDLTYTLIAKYAYLILFAMFLAYLLIDLLSYLITRFFFIPRGIVIATDTLYHYKPSVFNIRALTRYVIYFALLLIPVFAIVETAKQHNAFYKQRQVVISELIIKRFEGDTSKGKEGLLANDEISQCLFNPNVALSDEATTTSPPSATKSQK